MLAGGLKAVWKAVKKGCNWWESPWGKGRVWCGDGGDVQIQCHYCSQVQFYVTVKLIAVPIPPLALLFLPFPLHQIWHCCHSSLNWFCSLSQWKTTNYCFRWVIFHQISSCSLCACINCQICCQGGDRNAWPCPRGGKTAVKWVSYNMKLHPWLRVPSWERWERQEMWAIVRAQQQRTGSKGGQVGGKEQATGEKIWQKHLRQGGSRILSSLKKGKTKMKSFDGKICCSASGRERWAALRRYLSKQCMEQFCLCRRWTGWLWLGFPEKTLPNFSIQSLFSLIWGRTGWAWPTKAVGNVLFDFWDKSRVRTAGAGTVLFISD